MMPISNTVSLINRLKGFLSGNVEEQLKTQQWMNQRISSLGIDPQNLGEILAGTVNVPPIGKLLTGISTGSKNPKYIREAIKLRKKLPNLTPDELVNHMAKTFPNTYTKHAFWNYLENWYLSGLK
jgi:hypothetical protein